jgi:hypothetical protein
MFIVIHWTPRALGRTPPHAAIIQKNNMCKAVRNGHPKETESGSYRPVSQA